MITQKKKWCETARKVSEEGSILLKNENHILPLKSPKVAIFGMAQTEEDGSQFGESKHFTGELKRCGAEVDEILYARYLEKTEKKRQYNACGISAMIDRELKFSEGEIREVKERGAQTALILLSRMSWENSDMKVEIGDYYLAPDEEKMIADVCAVFDRVVLILKIGCQIDMRFLEAYPIGAVLYVNQYREYGAEAIWNILSGAVNPSGKLPFTMARTFEDYPSSAHFGEHGGGILQDYVEDIFIGYRYFDTFEKHDAVVYPFGFGLSYTEFSSEVTDFRIEDEIRVTVRVKNIGDCAGKETVQGYFSPPQLAEGAKLGRPKKELCAFEKTKLLAPGESQDLVLCIKPEKMAGYDDTGILGVCSAWVMERGTYRILVGNSSVSLTEAGVYEETETRILKHCTKLPSSLGERLLADGTHERIEQSDTGKQYDAAILPNGKNVIAETSASRNFSEMKAGEESVLRIYPGVGGGYSLSAEGTDAPIEELFDLEIDGLETALKTENGNAQITLQMQICTLKFTAKYDLPKISAIVLEKTDTTVSIPKAGKVQIPVERYYECSYRVGTASELDREGNLVHCLNGFWGTGHNVVYRLMAEEAGNYEISFRYRYTGERDAVGNILSLAVSNIAQPVVGADFHAACDAEGEPTFVWTEPAVINLPKGISYLKMIVEKQPFPDICGITLERTERETAEMGEKPEETGQDLQWHGRPQLDPDDGVRKEGLLLCDVYEHPEKTEEFLKQLSNRELAIIVSGTGLNKTDHAFVGCNHPLYSRGIPPAQTSDGPCGLFQPGVHTVQYPAGLILAASFSKELYAEYGDVLGEECVECDVDLWLAPSINLFRSPCGGRNSSYASEDPYLSGIYASEQIRAVQKHGVAAVLKHYCANNTEHERLKSNSRVSERALRELYIKGFEIAVRESDPWAIMSSYNNVNDVKACEDKHLITDIPRGEWGWDGVFVTDWWNDSDHTAELLAGHDLKMATGDIDGVEQSLNEGILSREQVYPSAARILRMLMKLRSVREFLENERKG